MIKLGEISEIKGGKRLPKGCDFVEQETKYKYIRARDIGEGKIKCDELQYIDEKTYETIKNYTVSTNDVCITIVGANIGDIGIVSEEFVNFRFPGYEKCEFVDGVPKGWSKVHLSEIVSTQYGFTESALNEDTGVKYLRGKDINKTSYINWSSVPWCKIEDNQKDKYALKKHDILVIRMADPGKVGIVEEDIEAVFASYLIRININNDNIKPYYLFYFLNSDFYQQFISQSSTGATRKSANAKLITDVDILMPEKKVIEQFETKITDLRVLLNNLLQQNQKLKEARDILIPKLIMGEIEV
ncbi:restriction endonuclease subunit S [Clostridium novyi]|uniref:restriction endonuclease subunit S n=1 Tax=Clostridium novyi TaxID=1542 RepID=UPI0004D67379|nr:restriction endonuclease subunit S [Clostridium novyi]KEH91724.1 hypothetical protein Z964_08735 [Clostridium novyi A str. GD211209]